MKKLFVIFLMIGITAAISRGAPSFTSCNGNEDNGYVTSVTDLAIIGANEMIQGVAITETESVMSAQQVSVFLPSDKKMAKVTGELVELKLVGNPPPLISVNSSSFNNMKATELKESRLTNAESEVLGVGLISIYVKTIPYQNMLFA